MSVLLLLRCGTVWTFKKKEKSYLFCNFLYTSLEFMHHITHLQSFIGAQLVEVMVMGHALVEMPQWFPPCDQQLQNHGCQLFSLQ